VEEASWWKDDGCGGSTAKNTLFLGVWGGCKRGLIE